MSDVPRFNLTANTEIRFPTGSYTPFIRGLLNYKPGFYSTTVGYRYRSSVPLNLYIGVEGDVGRWEVHMYAKNLLNQVRINDISAGNQQITTRTPGVVFDSGYRTVTVGLPRELGMTARFNF